MIRLSSIGVRNGLALLIISALCVAGMSAVVAQEGAPTDAELAVASSQFAGVIRLAVGQTANLKVQDLDRFQVGAPNVVSVQKSEDGTQLLITGKRVGSTVVNVWQKGEMSSYQVQVLSETAEPGPMVAGAQSLTLRPGASQIIHGKGIRRTATSDPNAVDIVPVSTTEVILNAKAPGTSVVRIWDDYGMSTYNITVEEPAKPKVDLGAEITREIGIPGVSAQVSQQAGRTVVTLIGEVPHMELSQQAERTASAYGKVQNLIKVESETPSKVVDSLKEALNNPALSFRVLPDETILIEGTVPSQEDAQKIKWIIETWLGTEIQEQKGGAPPPIYGLTGEAISAPNVNSTSRLQIGAQPTTGGADIAANDERNIVRHVWGGRLPEGPRLVAIIEVNPALSKQILVKAQIVEIDRSKLTDLGIDYGSVSTKVDQQGNITFSFVPQPYTLAQNPTEGTVNELFKGPPLVQLQPFAVQLSALITQNKARILSEPKVLIVDGGVANIHVGGQIPIPVAQTSVIGGAGAISVQWKDFGILLTVRPEITEDGSIFMNVSPESSSLDFAQAVTVNGFEIPALRTRRATSSVHLNDGDSLVIGGLISNEDAKLVRKIPLLSEIPIIGKLFTSNHFVKNETELVIVVTPQIVQPGCVPAAATGAAPAVAQPAPAK